MSSSVLTLMKIKCQQITSFVVYFNHYTVTRIMVETLQIVAFQVS